MKHLTFQTIFLLALASGKCRSKIHAWVNRNIHRREDWSQVSLYPCEGPNSVAPVVITALAPALDKSLKSLRVQTGSTGHPGTFPCLGQILALCFYLDRIKDLRRNKQLVFVSCKKNCDRGISPATKSLLGSNSQYSCVTSPLTRSHCKCIR